MEEEEEVHVVGMISLILEASLNPWSFLSIKKIYLTFPLAKYPPLFLTSSSNFSK